MENIVDILGLDRVKLEEFVLRIGEPKYRAQQLFSWLHEKRVGSFDLMTNIGAATRSKLEQSSFILRIKAVRKQRSSDGTVKYLFLLPDGNCVETVAMSYKHGISVCVSSQVGCRMGCRFCASAKGGFVRCLAISEILSQVYAVSADLGERVDSVVLMGTGEPLDNFDNVLGFYSLVTDPNGYNMSNRSVSLSTCGLVGRIRQLADMKLQLTLSVSLHAVDDKTRDALMPINKKYPIAQLLDACRYYFEQTGRRISFEYAVISGVNDGELNAEKLASLLSGMHAHVNLIPVNAGGDFSGENAASAQKFCEYLNKKRQNATVRRTLGTDIDAACGQLRNRYMEEENLQ